VEKYNKAKKATDDIIRRRKDAICVPNKHGQNTDISSEYVILIVFPLQQWLHEIALLLCYTMLPALFF